MRPVEGRLTGGFLHARHPTPLPSGATQRRALGQALRALGDDGASSGTRHRSPRALADLGVRELLDGDWDAAVSRLEQARVRAPNDTWVLNDLAVAHTARAAEHRRAHDLLLALAAAEEAVAQASAPLEAWFNRALALTHMRMAWAAVPAWRDYLRRDPRSPWADEARRHLQALSGPSEDQLWRRGRTRLMLAARRGDAATVERIVTRFRMRSRRWAEEDLLARWAEQRQRGRPEQAADALRIAHAVGEAQARLGGARLLLEAVQRIEWAAAESDRDARGAVTELISGHLAYRDGMRAFDAKGRVAAPSLLRAQDALARGGSPLAHWATVFVAATEAFQPSLRQDLERRLAAVERATAGRSYPVLISRVLWIRGLSELVRSEYESALRRHREALALARSTGEVEHAAVLEELIAEYHSWVGGSPEEVWRHVHRALAAYSRVPEPRRREGIVGGAAVLALAAGAPRVALHFIDEAVSVARQSGEPVGITSALVGRARSRWAVGRRVGAHRDLSEAERLARSIADEGRRVLGRTDVLLARGELLTELEPRAAAAALDQAIELLHATDYGAQLARSLHARARLRRRLGDRAGTRQDLEAALETIERQRGDVGPADRASFLDELRGVYTDLAALELEPGGRRELAYSYLEQSQARVLDDLLTDAGTAGDLDLLRIEEVQAALPPGTLLLQASAWDGVVRGWAITAERWSYAAREVGRPDLGRRLAEFRDALLADDPGAVARGKELSRLLLVAAEGMLRPGMDLVLVLGEGLHGLPASALVDPVSGRYLVAAYDLAVSPSARVALRPTTRCSRPPPGGPGLLWVSAPAISPVHFPELPPLDAEEEAQGEVEALFPRAEVLSGRGATVEAVLASTGRHELLHLATHAQANARDPMRSRILLAPGTAPDSSGVLTPVRLTKAVLDRTCLAELAACRTAQGPSSPTEGVLSLAYPFLAAGVPAVVGTLWQVEERAATAFSVELYRRLAAGDDVISAVSGAQRTLLASERPRLRRPAAWAGFQLVGRGSFTVVRRAAAEPDRPRPPPR